MKIKEAFNLVIKLIDELKEIFDNIVNINVDLKEVKVVIKATTISRNTLIRLEEFFAEEFCEDFDYYISRDKENQELLIIEIYLEDCVFE